MKRILLVGVPVFLAVLWLSAPPAEALKSFQKDFAIKYVKPQDGDPKEVVQKKAMLAKAIKEAKCNICHHGRDKKKRNAYGDELAKLLDKKADAKNTKKVIQAMEQVGKVKRNPRDKKSPTFADLISQGKLPVLLPPEKKKSRPTTLRLDEH